MKISERKFEAALHVGLLVIIFVLLFLNFRSNRVISRDLSRKRVEATVQFNRAALSISRAIQKENLAGLSDEQRGEFLEKHHLARIEVALTEDKSDIASMTGLASSELEYKTPLRGDTGPYWYIHPHRSADGVTLLVLAKDIPDLAYLDESLDTLIAVNLTAVTVIVALYLLLFRFILSPFKRIKKRALEAGRQVGRGGDEIEALVEEYENIIKELQEKESQLLELNRSIQQRADSLEHFNDYLLESMSSGLIMVDRTGTILSINKAASELLNLCTDDLTGKPLTGIPNFTAEMAASVDAILSDQTSRTYFEIEIRDDRDRGTGIGINISTVYDDELNIVGASLLINDLTEIRNLRSEAEARDRLAALGEMAGGLAHQLRNSIGAINGYSQLIKRRLLRADFDVEPINALEDETKEAENLVDRFMHFARPFDFTPEPTDVNELVNEVLDTVRIRRDFEHVEFVISNDTFSPAKAEVDGLLIKQALGNLVENAVNAYQDQPGRVEMRVATGGETVQIEISDYGCGIPEENLKKIFTPFFSSRPSGTGLGLPLTKKIIDLHHGRLTVQSEAGQGTTFTVHLPIRQPGSPPSPRPWLAQHV